MIITLGNRLRPIFWSNHRVLGVLFALMKAAGDIEGRRNNQVMERWQENEKRRLKIICIRG